MQNWVGYGTMFLADHITGQVRIVAPNRAQRLGPRPEGCPFCLGNEEHTPPEIDRIIGDDGVWRARAVPNLFPLSDVHEVLIPTHRHATSLRELTPDEWVSLVELWQRRLTQAPCSSDRYLHLFVNDGKGAGASLPHTHAQLVSVPRSHEVLSLTHHLAEGEECAACALLTSAEELLIAELGAFQLLAHPTPRTGGGMLLYPIEHHTDATTLPVAALAQALHCAVQALPDGDFNCWLVHDPHSSAHTYVEFVPRTSIPAGVEMALGIGVSIIDPEAAAAAARERLAGALPV